MKIAIPSKRARTDHTLSGMTAPKRA